MLEMCDVVALGLGALAVLFLVFYLLSPVFLVSALLSLTFGVLAVVMCVFTRSVPVSEIDVYVGMIESLYAAFLSMPLLPDRPLYVAGSSVVTVGEKVRVMSPMFSVANMLLERSGITVESPVLDEVAVRDYLHVVLVESVHVCSSVVVSIFQDNVKVVLVKPPRRLSEILYKYVGACRRVGSPLASLVATLLVLYFRRPVEILSEEVRGKDHVITLRVS